MATKRQTFGDRMAVLKNQRHEIFAQAIASGETQEAAYRKAGYKPNASNASTLNRNQQVRERVAGIQANAAAVAEFTLADMVAQVDEDRSFARENVQPAAAISASGLKAKLLGLITDKVTAEVQTVRNVVRRSPVEAVTEWESEVAAERGESLN